jgi:hypothetical protein
MPHGRKVSYELTDSSSFTEAYWGPGALPSNRDAVRFGELSSAKAARPNPKTPVDAVRARTERPVHFVDVCPALAVLVALLVVEGLLRGVLVENVCRHRPMRRRVALFANMTWRRQRLHKHNTVLAHGQANSHQVI